MLKHGDIVILIENRGWNKIGDIAIVLDDEFKGGIEVKYEHEDDVVYTNANSFRKIDIEWLMKQVKGRME